MLSTKAFKAFAGRVVLFLHNTSRVEGEAFPNLLREKGGNGYPTVSFLDSTGRLLTQMPPKISSAAQLDATHRMLIGWKNATAALAKASADDKPKMQWRVFRMELGFGMLDYEVARTQLAKLRKGRPKAELAAVDQQLVDMQFLAINRDITDDLRTKAKAGAKFLAMIDANRIPKNRQVITFWECALVYAASRRDADLYERILIRGKKELKGDRRAERYIPRLEAQLKKMRAAGK